MRKPPTKKTSPRRNVYFRNPHIYEALQEAISRGIIKSRSASERLEELIANEVRRVAPKMRKAGISVPAEIFEK